MDSFDEFRRHRDLVQQPNGKGEGKAWCPWHPDREGGNPSLGINFTKRLVKCWVCGKGGAKELAEAWGIADDEPLSRQKDEIERTYDYLNSDRTLRFQVVRFRVPPGAAKKILQRRPDPAEPNAWIWNLKGVQPSLYRLPELMRPNLRRGSGSSRERKTLTACATPAWSPPAIRWALASGASTTTGRCEGGRLP